MSSGIIESSTKKLKRNDEEDGANGREDEEEEDVLSKEGKKRKHKEHHHHHRKEHRHKEKKKHKVSEKSQSTILFFPLNFHKNALFCFIYRVIKIRSTEPVNKKIGVCIEKFQKKKIIYKVTLGF